jgi:hypothetical protein
VIYLAISLFFFFIGACVAYDRHLTKMIIKPYEDNRPLTSEELKQMGIVAPERYDCETFVR